MPSSISIQCTSDRPTEHSALYLQLESVASIVALLSAAPAHEAECAYQQSLSLIYSRIEKVGNAVDELILLAAHGEFASSSFLGKFPTLRSRGKTMISFYR